MLYVGLDIHIKQTTVCVLNETGQVTVRFRVRTIQQLMQTLTELPDRFEVCYEASCGYGHYYDLLRPIATVDRSPIDAPTLSMNWRAVRNAASGKLHSRFLQEAESAVVQGAQCGGDSALGFPQRPA